MSIIDKIFAADLPRPEQTSAELKLMIAILERAILDAHGPAKIPLGIKRSAREWFLSDSEEPFSYRDICETIGIDRIALNKVLETPRIWIFREVRGSRY